MCQLHVQTLYLNLDQSFQRPGAEETAASVSFDGPSVPSGDCCPTDIFQKTLYFFLIFWVFSHILSDFIGLYIWNCLFRKSTLPPCQTSSEDHIYSIYSSKCLEISFKYTLLRCLKKVLSGDSGVSQNGRRRPPKGKRHLFLSHLGHYHPW